MRGSDKELFNESTEVYKSFTFYTVELIRLTVPEKESSSRIKPLLSLISPLAK